MKRFAYLLCALLLVAETASAQTFPDSVALRAQRDAVTAAGSVSTLGYAASSFAAGSLVGFSLATAYVPLIMLGGTIGLIGVVVTRHNASKARQRVPESFAAEFNAGSADYQIAFRDAYASILQHRQGTAIGGGTLLGVLAGAGAGLALMYTWFAD